LSVFEEMSYFEENNLYDELSHYYEIDADKYATEKLANHIIEYIKKLKLESNHQICTVIIGVLIATLTATFYNFLHGKQNIYLKKSTHPHSIVRALLSASILIDICERECKFDKQETTKNAFILVDKMTQSNGIGFTENIEKLFIGQYRAELNDYIEGFKKGIKENLDLFISK
jgi:hypothetical protein